jgi:hypothetical protein
VRLLLQGGGHADARGAGRAAMAMVSSENLSGVFSPRCYNRIFLLLLLVNVFALLEQVFFATIALWICTVTVAGGLCRIFFVAPMLY